jgi:hypothetical protein
MTGNNNRGKTRSFDRQVDAVQEFLRRRLPDRVRELFAPGSATSASLLPLSTGRERDPADTTRSDVERFRDAEERFNSVLGHTIGNSDLAHIDDDHVWPPGLLVVCDVGCAIYHAIDLDSAALRVIEYQHLEPVEDPAAANGFPLAYSEPAVPRALQHRFTIIAESLDEWLRAKLGS